MSIYLTGDTHHDISRFNPALYPVIGSLKQGDCIIVLGDFGFVYYDPPIKATQKAMKFLKNQPYNILFIDGNHENFNLINAKPIVEMYGAPVHKIANNIFHLMRGYVYTIEEHTFFTFGGAYSPDKNRRTPQVDWWPEEYPSGEEVARAERSLEQYNYSVDYVLTHTAPKSLVDYMLENELIEPNTQFPEFKDYVSLLLEILLCKVSFKRHYFGHFHNDVIINNHEMMYRSIKKLYQS